ncbi:MAG: cupredoxin domain-containing protein [Candidatus Anstonellales archaeon]
MVHIEPIVNQSNTPQEEPNEIPRSSFGCGCDQETRNEKASENKATTQLNNQMAKTAQINAQMNTFPFILASSLAILLLIYLVAGILSSSSQPSCESGNVGACPLDASLTTLNTIRSPSSNTSPSSYVTGTSGNKEVQDIYIRALSTGRYDKDRIEVKKGVPVRLHFSADKNAGCGRQLVIYGLNVRAISKSGEEQIVDFIPNREGTFEYNCGMRMFRGGKLVVV